MAAVAPSEFPVLLVDDEPELLRSASVLLRTSGLSHVITLEDGQAVAPLLAQQDIGALVLDLSMPHLSGHSVLAQVAASHPDIPVILMTATDDVDTAVQCMQTGAIDYLVKPVEEGRLVSAVKRALELRVLRAEALSPGERPGSDRIYCPQALSSPKLAKLARPQVSNAVLRHRLFTRLDEAQERPIVWIHGPPGAGKTTLLASYLAARKRSGIWYQIDSGDSDPASFFYYLGLAAAAKAPRKRRPMPLLTPEYLLDIEGFTRRFFRELCARLGDSTVLVFDNYQEAPAPSVLHKVMACALAELAPGICAVVLSRSEPPPEYARHLANSAIEQIAWEDLRLTLDETGLIATARQPVNAELIQTLHEQSGGWAAGLVLMVERLKQTGAVNQVAQPETLETVFNYFAGEMFEQLSASMREFLIRTCLVPQVTAELANALTGRSDAASMLAGLHKQQLFIDRRVGETLTYQYHALFRLFLQAQAKESQTEAQWKGLVVASAEALAAHGQVEEAVPLFVAGAAWEPAIRMIVMQAQALIALGRWKTVQQWIESLPEPIRNTTPWLRFWRGMCRLRVDPANARLDLEPAFALFQEGDDALGQALAATAINEAHMVEWIDYRRLDSWIAWLEALLGRRDVALPSLDTELAVRASLFTAIVLRQTYREDIPRLARQLADLLRHDLDPNYKLLAARGIFVYAAYSGDFALTDEVVSYTESAFCAPGASALNRAWYAARLGFALRYVKGSRERARAWFLKAREIVREQGLRFVEAPIATYWAWVEEVFGETGDLQRELRIAETYLNPASRFEAAFRQTGMAFVLARQNELGAAVARIAEGFSFFEQSGYTLGQVASNFGLASMRLSGNDFTGAREALDQALSLLFPGPLRSYADALLSAGIALGVKDEERAKAELRRALALGAKHGLENVLSEHFVRRTTAALCAYALKHGIEPNYVKRIIHTQHLAPPLPDIENWPWPVQIRALGGFSLAIEGRLLSFSGKAPKKPLELLKALVATGGTEVDIGWLGEQLWPDAEGDAARDVFNVTHSRLRKLLTLEGALLLRQGKLSLDPTQVWTDVWAFERTVADCLDKLQRGQALAIESAGERLLSLYAGDLLKSEPDAPWLIAARDRLRSKFLRTLKALGAFWETNEAWDQAQSLYERVLEIDNVAEEVYRCLMSCYARGGRPAEALRVYRRCCQMLSVVLGIAPSTETETLCRSIVQAQ